MNNFAALITRLDETNRTNEKVAALVDYFKGAEPSDAAWALSFLSGRKLKLGLNRTALRQWAAEEAEIPVWLLEECYDNVGDLSETMARVIPDEFGVAPPTSLAGFVEERILALVGADLELQKSIIVGAWHELSSDARFVFNKLLSSSFRIGVSQDLVVRAIGQAFKLPTPLVAHRLMGTWEPTGDAFSRLVAQDDGGSNISQPYPFCLAHPLESEVSALGEIADWQVEWKWDGIRAQVIHRNGEVFIWSRGEELINDSFPDLVDAARQMPDGTVIDGEIVAWDGEHPRSFNELQRRLGRKNPGKTILSAVRVTVLAYDLLEVQGTDLRSKPMRDRRSQLETLSLPFPLSPLVVESSWESLADLREESRQRGAEGFMLKRRDSEYGTGRKRGLWWKWKINPYSIDAVLTYAQKGSGRRANLFTDYTFGLWHQGELVTFAKAYSGLSDQEIAEVDAFIRRSVVEAFGPVRQVKPELVFELGFESIQISKRHKSGIAVRFPRILRWRKDKKADEADSIETLRALIAP
ncbi:MAG: ATP-dependent DNA ligase [Armatimonadetes bacterium]|nr:ATP-dependent DNA ligase [Armatimonadota bacterium]